MSSSTAVNIAVLDDYQQVAQSLGNWTSLQPQANVVFFHDHVGETEALAARLASFDAVVLMRERTRFDADLVARLPRLKLIVSVGMWNAAIDLDAAKSHGIVVSGTQGGDPAATPALTWSLILAVSRNLHIEAGVGPRRGLADPAWRRRQWQDARRAGTWAYR